MDVVNTGIRQNCITFGDDLLHYMAKNATHNISTAKLAVRT